MFNLKKIKPCIYEIPKEGGMLVPGLVIANDEMLKEEEMQRPLEQVRNVGFLPGIVGYSIAMPDIHWGYGFPIGGIAATDTDEGVISPGGVGYDINCGVRLSILSLPFSELSEKQKENLIHSISRSIPSGVGAHHKRRESLSDQDFQKIAEKGVRFSIDEGFGIEKDIEHIESHGKIEGADISQVSKHAKDRGKDQLGTLGSGNHFVEIGEISQIFLPEIAKEWGVEKGFTYVLIHSGSRGFGHQICQDTLDEFAKKGFGENLPDKQLMAAPFKSQEGKKYFAAMAVAANFAFNNRQRMLHFIRKSFQEVLGVQYEDLRLLYDVCHNIAKVEEYEINGKKKKLCVHRKGATRAFGKGAEELVSLFRKTGQPVLVPGDMERASFLLVGKGNPLTFCSCCHGAGRVKSRHQAIKSWKGRDPVSYMKERNVIVKAESKRTITEEMSDAYKDVRMVVDIVEEAGLADKVAKLRPHMVLKG